MNPTQITQILIAFGLSVVGSIISARVTVRLSLSRFRSERWWEKKAEAYSRLIEELALFEINSEWWDGQYDLWKIGVFPSTGDQGGQLSEQARDLRTSLKKTAAIGAYIVSEQAADALDALREALNAADRVSFDGGPDEWSRANQLDYEATKKCIRVLRECAKRELQSPS